MTSFFLALALSVGQTPPPPPPKAEAPKPHPMAGLRMRSLGPALMSGRIVGFAVHPENRAHYYVAVASGGVWKTTNAGVTWTPIFDNEGSYSIGCVVLDPKDPNTVWVGTGENNSQRSVGYGDGVYKSVDGGKTWRNVGLPKSEHIAKIVVDPRNSDTVYVAAQGPLWGPGGDRGLYKTTDGGKTWNAILTISENTGVTDFVLDPKNPDTIVAASYQRRRHVYTIVNGGPESAIHRTTDGGKSWTRIRGGLPATEMGRIGLAQAPTDPDTLYAIVEAADKNGGVYRSTDLGVTWEKRNPFDAQAQYYAHLVVDPKDKNRIYVMNVNIQVSDDGGRTLAPMRKRWVHVDHHELWIDPTKPDYYLLGNDGGIYESFDRGANWRHMSNLPVTQFYDVNCEQVDSPFYKVYGGTQDNSTLGGPNRTMSTHGITNADWHIIVGGDGFQSRVDPKDSNIVYAEYQYGGLVRFDWRTQQRVSIQPQPGVGEAPYRWNWDSPLIISPHMNTRLYFAANKLFRSDDRGDSWKAVSPDLTRQLDRNKLAVFGKILGPDAVFKHGSTSLYGNITALSESPKKEGLIYVGTDDGLVQVTEDGGTTWRKIDKFPGVPEMTYVARLFASQHDANTVYAVMENHKSADFKPYVLKSVDAGKTWASIAGDLPERGSALAFAEDHVAPNLLFVGTEFGLYVTTDGGAKWHRLKSGLPTIAVKDLCIQQPMNDLLVGTFGRGFYILDDYSSLRHATAGNMELPAVVFPVRDGFQYMPTSQFGGRGKAFMGEAFYASENAPYGAGITYHLKEGLSTKKQKRKEAERKEGFVYPTAEELRAEAEQEEPALLITIMDERGNPIRTITGPSSAGVHRVQWDLRLPAVGLGGGRRRGGDEEGFTPAGAFVVPGTYKVALATRVEGVVKPLSEAVAFKVKYVGPNPLVGDDLAALTEFQARVVKLQRDLTATTTMANELQTRLEQIKEALDVTPTAPADARATVRELIAKHRLVLRLLNGDSILQARFENTPPSIGERASLAGETLFSAIHKPTGTQREQYKIAAESLKEQTDHVRRLLEKDIPDLEKVLDKIGAPATPGRLPK